MESNGHVPILGSAKIRLGVSLGAMPRKLDTEGTFEAAGAVQGPNGIVPQPHRSDFVDAEELVEMVRAVVREELQASFESLRTSAGREPGSARTEEGT